MFLAKLGAALLFLAVFALFLMVMSIPFVLAVALIVAAVKLALFVVLIPFRLVGWALGLAVGR